MTPKIESAKPIESAEEFAQRYFGESSYRSLAHGTRLRQMIEARDEQIRAEGKAALRDEEERHAILQARCYEGFPSASDGIFDALREAEKAIEAGKVEGLKAAVDIALVVQESEVTDTEVPSWIVTAPPRKVWNHGVVKGHAGVAKAIRAEIERRGHNTKGGAE